ncbi:MAG: polysaccharide biosynthesis/export family protein [Bacteroidales bacterium]|nr:polysaccharide biosynthesis/export family protein [Bacteroidales bacterium]
MNIKKPPVRKNAGILALSMIMPVLFVSCTAHRQLVYLENLETAAYENYFPKNRPEYRIQTRDILYIKVYSLNEEMSDLINQTLGTYQQNLFQNETSLFINGYTVSDSGYIEIPVLGRIQVEDRTVNEAINAIRARANQYLKDATVIVKLISFKFSVIGEVNRPGTYNNYNSQLTVLEAISMAGDITDYGNRKKVLVLRPTEKGTTTFRLDLTNSNILTSDGFFLLPNDIVYVEPIQSKSFRINTPAFSLILTSISTLILVLNFVNR